MFVAQQFQVAVDWIVWLPPRWAFFVLPDAESLSGPCSRAETRLENRDELSEASRVVDVVIPRPVGKRTLGKSTRPFSTQGAPCAASRR